MQIGLVIPVFNNADLTKQCLDSLFQTKGNNPEFNVIVVDDGSMDNTDQVLSNFEGIHVLKNAENLGYLETTNKGIDFAFDNLKCDYILLLNNDLIFSSTWLANLIDSSELYDLVGYFSHNDNDVAKPTETDFVEFSCVCIKRAVFSDIGKLDPIFSKGYYSDDDYCLRAKLAGFKIAVTPNKNPVNIVHLCGQTFGTVTRNYLMLDMFRAFKQKWEPKFNDELVHRYFNEVVLNPFKIPKQDILSRVFRKLKALFVKSKSKY